MNIHRVYGVFNRHFRPRRIRALKAMLPQITQPGTTVLDIGGTAAWWREVQPCSAAITIVNLDRRHERAAREAGYGFVCADACALPFAEGSFDVVLSNSVIEHVGDAGRQARFAAEALRCGHALYVQTPNRGFPVEPHLVTFGLHWLPRSWQRRCIRWLSVWGWVARPTQAQIDAFVASTRMLRAAELRRLFPRCEIVRETVLGLTKSFCVVRH